MSGAILCRILFLVCCVSLSSAQNAEPSPTVNITNGLERIGNFSIEMLYHTSITLQSGQNFVISPITVWNILALIAEGAYGQTRYEIQNAIRWNSKQCNDTKYAFKAISSWLQLKTPDTTKLAKISTMLVAKERLPLKDFLEIAKREYETEVLALDFKDNVRTAEVLNTAISNVTHGWIKKIIEPGDFNNAAMVLTSALYFKGEWSIPFNASSTAKMPFFSSKGDQIGEVNMMNNKGPYAYANIKELQAEVIEIPYGKENRLSMVIMLPDPGVSVEEMTRNFENVKLDQLLQQINSSPELDGVADTDCSVPRFKIESDLDLSHLLKFQFSVKEVFDPLKARLPLIARTPLYVSKIIHKAEIEITEEGTTAAGVIVAEFSNHVEPRKFKANRPFSYIIIEKLANSILFGGMYKTPSLY